MTKPRGIKCKEMPGNTDQVQQISLEPSVIISKPQRSSQVSGAHQLLQSEGLQRGNSHLRFPSAVRIHFVIETRDVFSPATEQMDEQRANKPQLVGGRHRSCPVCCQRLPTRIPRLPYTLVSQTFGFWYLSHPPAAPVSRQFN